MAENNSQAMVQVPARPSYEELMAMLANAQNETAQVTNALKRSREEAEIKEAATRDEKTPPVPWLVPKSVRRGNEWIETDLPQFCQQKQTQILTQPGAWLQNCVRTRDKTCNQSCMDPSKDNGFFPYSADLKERIKAVLNRGILLRTFGDMCGVPPRSRLRPPLPRNRPLRLLQEEAKRHRGRQAVHPPQSSGLPSRANGAVPPLLVAVLLRHEVPLQRLVFKPPV